MMTWVFCVATNRQPTRVISKGKQAMMNLIVWLLSLLLAIGGSPTARVLNSACHIDNVDRALVVGDLALVHFAFDDAHTYVLATGCHGWEMTPGGVAFVEF